MVRSLKCSSHASFPTAARRRSVPSLRIAVPPTPHASGLAEVPSTGALDISSASIDDAASTDDDATITAITAPPEEPEAGEQPVPEMVAMLRDFQKRIGTMFVSNNDGQVRHEPAARVI